MNAEDMERFADVPLELRAEIDRYQLPLRQILALRRGAVLRILNRNTDSLAVTAGSVPIGEAEAVILGGKPAIRLTRVLGGSSPAGEGAEPLE